MFKHPDIFKHNCLDPGQVRDKRSWCLLLCWGKVIIYINFMLSNFILRWATQVLLENLLKVFINCLIKLQLSNLQCADLYSTVGILIYHDQTTGAFPLTLTKTNNKKNINITTDKSKFEFVWKCKKNVSIVVFIIQEISTILFEW